VEFLCRVEFAEQAKAAIPFETKSLDLPPAVENETAFAISAMV